jgi:hypothetical protein
MTKASADSQLVREFGVQSSEFGVRSSVFGILNPEFCLLTSVHRSLHRAAFAKGILPGKSLFQQMRTIHVCGVNVAVDVALQCRPWVKPLIPMVMPFLINRAASSAVTTLSKSDFRRIRSLCISLSPDYSPIYCTRAFSTPAIVIRLRPRSFPSSSACASSGTSSNE